MMNKNYPLPTEPGKGLLILILGLVLAALIGLCSSCSKKNYHDTVETVTAYEYQYALDSMERINSKYEELKQNTTKKDSIYIYKKDSVVVTQKGDTCYIDRWHYQESYKESYLEYIHLRMLIDSLAITNLYKDSLINAKDSTRVEYREVVKHESTWVFTYMFIVLIVIIAYFGFRFIR